MVQTPLLATLSCDISNSVLSGEVISVGVLPDSQNRWMNPDLKVYLTTISIEGSQDWLKPGMTAKVEIMINRLNDVVHVPVQCVVTENEEQVCYIARRGRAERRVVTTGDFNDEFIVVKSGVQEGEQVLLRPPNSPAAMEKKAAPANGEKPAAKNAKPVAATKKD